MNASNQEAFFNSYILHCYGIKRGTNIEEANSFFVSVSDNICSEGASAFLLSVLRALNDTTVEYDDYIAIICARHIQDCCLQSPLVSTETLVLLESAVLEVLANRAISGTMSTANPFQNQYEKTLAAILIAYLKFDAFPSILSSASLCSPVVASCRFAILQKVAEVFLDNRVVLSGSSSNYLEFINFPNNKYNVGLAYSNIVAESSRMSIKVSSICSSVCTILASAATVSASSPSSPPLSSASYSSLTASTDLESILEQLNNGISELFQCIACLSRWSESLGNLFATSSWTLQIVLDHAISNNLCPISDNAILHLIDTTEKLQAVSCSIGGCGSIPKLQDLLTSLHELLVSYVLQSTNSFDTSVSNISHGVLEAVIQGLVPPRDIVSELKHLVSGAYTMRYFHSLVDISEMIAGSNIRDWQLATLRHFVDTSDVDSIINSTMTRCSFLVVNDSEVGDDGDTRNMSLILTIADNLSTIVDKFTCFLSEPNKLRDFIILFLQSKFGVSLSTSASSSLFSSQSSMFWSRTIMSSSTSQTALALGAMSQLYCIPHCHIAESLLEVLSVFPKLGSEAKTFLSSLGPTFGVFLCHVSMSHCRIPRSINPANILVYERKIRSLWNNSSIISRKSQNSASDVLSFEDDNALDTRIHFRQEMPTLLSSLCKNWNYYDDISENLYQRTIAHIDRMSLAIQGLLASPSSKASSAGAEIDAGSASPGGAGGDGSDSGGGVESAPTIDACTWAALQNELELLIYSCYVLADVAGEMASSGDCPARSRWDEFMAVLTLKFKALASVLIETKTCDELFLVVTKRFLELWIRYLDLLSVSVESLSDTVAAIGDTSFSYSEIACNLIQLACSIFELNSIDLMTISSHIIWCMWYNHPVLVYNFSSPLSQWYDRVLFDRGSQSLVFSNIDDPQFHERLFFSFGKSIMFLNSEEEFVSLFKKSFDLIFLTLDLCTKPSEVSISENLRLGKISLFQLKGLIKGVYSPRSLGSDADAEADDDDADDGNDGEHAADAKITLATASEYLKSNFYVIITGLLGLTLWLQKEIFIGRPSVSSHASASAISEGDIEVADQILTIISSTLTNICESLQLEEGLIGDIISKLQEIFSHLGANSSSLFSFAASIIRNSIHPSFHSAKLAFFDLTASILQDSMSLISSDEGITAAGRRGAGASKAGAYIEGAIRVYHNLISEVVRGRGDAAVDDTTSGGGSSGISSGYVIDTKLIELTSFFINMTNSFTRTSFSHDLVVEASMVRIVIAAVRASTDLYAASGVDLSLIGSTVNASTALYETCLTALFSNEVSARSRKFNSQLLEAQAKLLFHFISNGLHEVVIPRMTSITQAILQAVSQIPADSSISTNTSTSAASSLSSLSSSSSTPLKTSLIDPSVLFGELSTAIDTADFNSFKAIINKTFKILNSKS